MISGIALLMMTPASWFLAYREHHQEQRTDAASYEIEPSRKVFERCGPLAGQERLICLAEAQEVDREDRERQYDLEAQQDMAEFAAAVTILSFLGLLITSAGVFGVYDTLRMQRQQFAAERRPWIDVNQIELTEPLRLFGGEYWGAKTRVSVKNVGQSPAVHVAAVSEWVHEDDTDRVLEMQTQVREMVKGSRPKYPMTLFPTVDKYTGTDSRFDESEKSLVLAKASEGKYFVRPALIGVVRYESPHSRDVFTTTFMVTALLKDSELPGIVVDVADDETHVAPIDSLELRMFAGGWDAD